MNRNRVKGKAKELQGRAMRGVGKATGSRKARVKGALREAEGRLQGEYGRMQDAGDRRGTVRIRTTRTTTIRRKRGR